MNGVNGVKDNGMQALLAQMRSMAREARDPAAGPGGAAPGAGGVDGVAPAAGAQSADGAKAPDFSGLLSTALGQVNDLQVDANRKSDAFLRGDNIPIADVMVSMEKSKVAFEATRQVRNRLVEAYREIFNMPV